MSLELVSSGVEIKTCPCPLETLHLVDTQLLVFVTPLRYLISYLYLGHPFSLTPVENLESTVTLHIRTANGEDVGLEKVLVLGADFVSFSGLLLTLPGPFHHGCECIGCMRTCSMAGMAGV